MRHRTTRRSLALGVTAAAFAIAAAPAGATVTDATDGYRLAPAQQRLSGDTAASAPADAAVTVIDDVISKARSTDAVTRAERRLRDAGVDTDALRNEIRGQLREAGIDPAALRAAVGENAPAVRDANVDLDRIMRAIRSQLRGANVDLDQVTAAVSSRLRAAGLDTGQLPDAVDKRQNTAKTIDADRLRDTIRRQLRDAGVDATAADDAAARTVGAAREAVPNIGELTKGMR
jgi:ClpA/ClpB-like protein